MNTMDDLFREKLVDHSIAPSGAAWQRVTDTLSKKNRTILWFRSAAIFVIMCLLLGLIRTSQITDAVPVANRVRPDKKDVGAEKSVSVPHAADNKKVVTSKKAAEQRERASLSGRLAIKEQQTAVPVIPQPEAAENLAIDETKVEPSINPEPAVKPIVLVYTLGPVENPGAETAAAKDGSLKKVVEFARNVKNTDTSPVGELRTMKEDLFALDFKKITTGKKQ